MVWIIEGLEQLYVMTYDTTVIYTYIYFVIIAWDVSVWDTKSVGRETLKRAWLLWAKEALQCSSLLYCGFKMVIRMLVNERFENFI